MLQNLKFWLKTRPFCKKLAISKFFWSKIFKFQRFLPPKPEIAQLQGFYCIFKWQYFQFWSKISKFFFRRLLERKNTSILSPNRIFNSWRGFYCIFKWQYFGILREKAKIENWNWSTGHDGVRLSNNVPYTSSLNHF